MILRKKYRAGGIMFPEFQTILQTDSQQSESEVAQSCPTLCDPHQLQTTRFLCPWDFPGKNTEVGCHFLLQQIFLTQGLNLGLLHCRQVAVPSEPPRKWYDDGTKQKHSSVEQDRKPRNKPIYLTVNYSITKEERIQNEDVSLISDAGINGQLHEKE